MNLFTMTGIALGLAMDALAVSIACGVTIKHLKIRHSLRIGLFFGFFQAFMPVIGWLAGKSIRDAISGVDHWIVFGLMGIIGGKMIYESFKIPSNRKGFDPLHISVLLFLSIATSIDALAVGIGFAFLQIAIITPVIIIGIITFLLSFAGTYIGHRMGHFFERKIEFAGGAVLIVMGTKFLVEHLVS